MLDALLPIRGMIVTLRCTREARFSFFHQPALRAFLCNLPGVRHTLQDLAYRQFGPPPRAETQAPFERFLYLRVPESGRVIYQPGEGYHFGLFGLPDSEAALAQILAALRELPKGFPDLDGDAPPFRDNWVFTESRCAFSGRLVSSVEALQVYDMDALLADLVALPWTENHPWLTLQFRSPVRLQRSHHAHSDSHTTRIDFRPEGERLFCCGHDDLNADLFLGRVQNALAALLRNRKAPRIEERPPCTQGQTEQDLFWVDATYCDKPAQNRPPRKRAMGGLLGELRIQVPRGWLGPLVLAERVGIGQNRAFGFGEFHIVGGPHPPLEPTSPLLGRTFSPAAPLPECVLQQSVIGWLAPAMDALFSSHLPPASKGNRRHQREERAGYGYILEGDTQPFSHALVGPRLIQSLAKRLRALWGNDPLVDRVMAWVTEPMTQVAAPLHALLARLFLEDLQADLAHWDLRLLRFGNDFALACRSSQVADTLLAMAREPAPQTPFLAHLLRGVRRQVGPEGNRTLPRIPWPPVEGLAKPGVQAPLGPSEKPEMPQAQSLVPAPQDRPEKTAAARSRALKVLVVGGERARLRLENGRVVAERSDQDPVSVPLKPLDAILLFGPHAPTAPLQMACLGARIPIHWATSHGTYLGSTSAESPGPHGNALWLAQAAAFAVPTLAWAQAQEVVRVRLEQTWETLETHGADGLRLRQHLESFSGVPSLDVLRGIEGGGAHLFFQGLRGLLPDWMGFTARNRRPPRDPFNALLSLGYATLYAHVGTWLRVKGLHPWLGFYHQGRGDHHALASDLVEPFRHLVERHALTQVQQEAFHPEDFSTDPDGCTIAPPAFRSYMRGLLETLQGDRFQETLRVRLRHLIQVIRNHSPIEDPPDEPPEEAHP